MGTAGAADEGQSIAADALDEGLLSDQDADQLTVGAGADLFIISLGDVITDLGLKKSLASLDGYKSAEGDVIQIV